MADEEEVGGAGSTSAYRGLTEERVGGAGATVAYKLAPHEERVGAAGITPVWRTVDQEYVGGAGITIAYNPLHIELPPGYTDYYPHLFHGEMVPESHWRTEVVQYESGWSQRNAGWPRPLQRFRMRYPIITETQYRLLWNFFSYHQGAYRVFWIQDYTEPNPRGKVLSVGDGTTYEFKMPHDAMDAAVVYRDGIIDGLASIELLSGIVTYAAPPPDGVLLTYDADNAYYLARFETDQLPGNRHKFIHWGAEVLVTQAQATFELPTVYPGLAQEVDIAVGGAGAMVAYRVT